MVLTSKDGIVAFLVGFLLAYIFQWSKDRVVLPIHDKRDHDLVVGVLSARDHFEQREIIRETWMSAYKDNSRVNVMFVVGSRFCDIHPENKIDEFGCQRWNVSILDSYTDLHLMSVQSVTTNNDSGHQNSYQRFKHTLYFKLMHPVVIKMLGLFVGVNLGKEPVTVVLYNESSQEEILQTSYSSIDPGVFEHSHYRYQRVLPVTLPQVLTKVYTQTHNSTESLMDSA